MKKIVTIFVLITLSSSAFADIDYDDASPSRDQKIFKFSDFLGLVKNIKADKVEKVIPRLPGEFLKNYTLIKNSSSLQISSPKNPRAILFGDTGHLILSFNGVKDQDNYDTIETAEYDESTKRIYYREVHFKKDLKKPLSLRGLQLSEDEIAFQNKDILVTKENPMKCMLCHTERPYQQAQEILKKGKDRLAKYIWSPYNQWRGAFGENDDQEFKENEDFKIYKDNARHHPRYAWLATDPQNPSFPFHGGGESFSSVAHRNLGTMPNFRLLELLTLHYAEQTAHIVVQNPLWSEFGPRYILNLLKSVYVTDLKFSIQDQLKAYLDQNRDQEFAAKALENISIFESEHTLTEEKELGDRIIFVALGWNQNFFSFFPNGYKLDNGLEFNVGINSFLNGGSLESIINNFLVLSNPKIKKIIQGNYLDYYKKNYRSKDIYFYNLNPRQISEQSKLLLDPDLYYDTSSNTYKKFIEYLIGVISFIGV